MNIDVFVENNKNKIDKERGKKNMKIMKNKKGFTLVELLAVIAILAILVIMALPAVLRMYRQSRINNFQNEVRSTFKAAQSQFLGDSITLDSGEKILYTNADSCTPTGVDSVKALDMTGNSNFKYYVLINVDGKVLNVRATNGTYSYSIVAEDYNHDLKVENIEVETNNESTLDSDMGNEICLTEESNYKPHIATIVEGQTCGKTDPECELTIAGENFYVVSSNSSETVLLAKFALNSSNKQGTQSDSLPQVMFYDNDMIAYWDACLYSAPRQACNTSLNGLISPYNANNKSYCINADGENCAYVYDENAIYIYPVISAYESNISSLLGIDVKGRLLTLEEAHNLSTEVRKDVGGVFYWLGSAYDRRSLWKVDSYGNIANKEAGWYGLIRPVIVVPTSDL